MRTKTVLLTAVLGIVGAATVSAQVYSVNVVGYVNTTFKAGFNLKANPLDNKATDGNTIATLFAAALPDGSYVYKFDNATGKYLAAIGYTSLFGWDDAAKTTTLTPGQGAFISCPPGSPDVTITFVGDVMQGELSNPLKTGFNMVSSMVPQAGKLQADLGYVPKDGDAIYQHTPGGGYKPTTSFTTLFNWDPADPAIEVGEAFWISTLDGWWSRTFTVQ